MPAKDEDPVTPNAVAGLFRDAREVSRVVQAFAISVSGAPGANVIDAATLLAVETLAQRSDVDASAGSITVLMSGETAGMVVAQPLGAPALTELGDQLVKTLGSRFRGAQIAIGMATTAEHKDLDLDDALAVAVEGLVVAASTGASRAVHSELYELTLATRRRQGTVFPLESVRHGDSYGTAEEDFDDYVLRPTEAAAGGPMAVADLTAKLDVAAGSTAEMARETSPETLPDTLDRPDVLGEFDDPFAHLASEAYELNRDSAQALTNGIAPKSEAALQLERESRVEIERLRMELDVARRDKLDSRGNEAAMSIQERRIEKLLSQLEKAEAEIARLSKNEDHGVESVYRSVQGLDPSEPAAKTKRVMIEGVFESNREPAKKPDET